MRNGLEPQLPDHKSATHKIRLFHSGIFSPKIQVQQHTSKVTSATPNRIAQLDRRFDRVPQVEFFQGGKRKPRNDRDGRATEFGALELGLKILCRERMKNTIMEGDSTLVINMVKRLQNGTRVGKVQRH
jgi:hypothetical protein